MEYLTLTVECDTIRVSISSGISFSSIPSGADIYIIASGGGPPIYIGLQTPNIINLPVGDYDYILTLTGFEDYTDTVAVNLNMITEVMANLIPKTLISAPVLVAASSVSILGFMLTTTAKEVIPITTGMLSGNVVTVKL
jgi:hypothetical protein